jgi:hypothetical protein
VCDGSFYGTLKKISTMKNVKCIKNDLYVIFNC